MEDLIYYKDSNVTITRTRFITEGKTYVMKNISSVELGIVRTKATLQYAIFVIGVILLIYNIYIAISLIIIGLGWMTRLQDKFSVRINSTSGESDAFVSNNENIVTEIVESINKAIIEN